MKGAILKYCQSHDLKQGGAHAHPFALANTTTVISNLWLKNYFIVSRQSENLNVQSVVNESVSESFFVEKNVIILISFSKKR